MLESLSKQAILLIRLVSCLLIIYQKFQTKTKPFIKKIEYGKFDF